MCIGCAIMQSPWLSSSRRRSPCCAHPPTGSASLRALFWGPPSCMRYDMRCSPTSSSFDVNVEYDMVGHRRILTLLAVLALQVDRTGWHASTGGTNRLLPGISKVPTVCHTRSGFGGVSAHAEHAPRPCAHGRLIIRAGVRLADGDAAHHDARLCGLCCHRHKSRKDFYTSAGECSHVVAEIVAAGRPTACLCVDSSLPHMSSRPVDEG